MVTYNDDTSSMPLFYTYKIWKYHENLKLWVPKGMNWGNFLSKSENVKNYKHAPYSKNKSRKDCHRLVLRYFKMYRI